MGYNFITNTQHWPYSPVTIQHRLHSSRWAIHCCTWHCIDVILLQIPGSQSAWILFHLSLNPSSLFQIGLSKKILKLSVLIFKNKITNLKIHTQATKISFDLLMSTSLRCCQCIDFFFSLPPESQGWNTTRPRYFHTTWKMLLIQTGCLHRIYAEVEECYCIIGVFLFTLIDPPHKSIKICHLCDDHSHLGPLFTRVVDQC